MKLWRVDSFYIITIILLLLCSSIPVFGQAEAKTSFSQSQLDSLARYYNLSKADSLSIPERLQHVSSYLKGILLSKQDSLIYDGLMQKTWLLGKVRQYDSAITYAHQFYTMAKYNQDTMYIINALNKLSIYYKNDNQLAEAFNYYNEKFKLYRIIEDTIGAGRSLLNMANIQTSLGDHSGSKTTAVDGVTYLERTSDLRNLAGLYHIISVANREQKNYREAIKYNSKAMALGNDSISVKTIGIKNILILKYKSQYIG